MTTEVKKCGLVKKDVYNGSADDKAFVIVKDMSAQILLCTGIKKGNYRSIFHPSKASNCENVSSF